MPYDPKVIHLPGTKLSPEVVLHRTVNKLDHIKAVFVVIQWKDDTFDCDWSQMKVSDLCMAEKIMDITVREQVVVNEEAEN